MIRRLLVLLVVFTCLGSISCESPDRFAELDSAITDFVADHGLSGANLIVVHRDRGVLHQRSFGTFTRDRISLLASSSKILSVGVIMRLVDQGLLDLDAPISNYLSAWGQHKTNITVAQMLSNSSGMPGLVDDPTYPAYLCNFFDGDTLNNCGMTIYQAQDTADLITPDTEFHYGGGQWQLAGSIAEVVSGKTWAQLVTETYNDPCGLDVLGYSNHYAQAFFQGGVTSGFAYPEFFQGDLGNLPVTQNPNIEGGAYANIDSYGQVLLMHLRGGQCPNGRSLSEASVSRMQQDRIGQVYGGSTIDPTLPGYGLGWWVSRDEPGYVVDPGAFGAIAWLDVGRGYAVMIILESDATIGAELRLEVEPIAARIIDRAGF